MRGKHRRTTPLSRLRAALRVSAVVFVFASLASCVYDATAVRLVITTTVAPGHTMLIRTLVVRGATVDLATALNRTDWTEFTVVTGQTSLPDAGTRPGAPDSGLRATLPVTLGVVPHSGDPPNEVVSVIIEGLIDPGARLSVLLRRVISFTFAVHQTQSYSVTLSTYCLDPDVGCTMAPCTTQRLCEEGGQTCGNDGTCVAPGVGLNSLDSGLCNPLSTLCSGACVDTRSDFFNCGQCGHRCASYNFCSGGTCMCAFTMCGGACVDTTVNNSNCGVCGQQCAAGQSCVNSVCR